MANAVTLNMGIELPTPGVTGALGVEPPGASWLELLNSGFDLVDAHDHSPGKGAPLGSASISIDADLPFNGFNATGLGSVRFVEQVSPLASGADNHCAYFVGGDFYINNGSGTAVRITNGADVVGAPGNITGLVSPAAVSFDPYTGLFTFESSTGVEAGIEVGPISIFDPVSGGKKVILSAPAGLAADYGLTLPDALPATKKVLFLDSTGVITAEDVTIPSVLVDGTSIVSVDGVLSVKDLGIGTPKIADLAVTAAKIANGAIPTSKLAAPNLVVSASSGTPTSPVSGDIPNLAVEIVTGGRPVAILMEGDASGGSLRSMYGSGATSTFAVQIQRSAHGAGSWTTVASFNVTAGYGSGVEFTVPPSVVACVDQPAAGDWDYKAVVSTVADSSVAVYPDNCKLVVREI